MLWSETEIDALSLDPATLSNGRALAVTSRWSNLGCTSTAVWGECQGSGKQPYRVCIDRCDRASKCTCPSRKFPCKHSVGLLFLFARQPGSFPQSEAPSWVAAWLEGRQQRREKAEQAADKPADSEAQAKRQDAREAKVGAGMIELRQWLRDLARHGLADDRLKTYEFWDRIAARMVDAQAGGIARRLRALAGLPFQGKADWAARMLDEISRLYLVVESYERIETLPPDLQHDIRTFIGWTVKQEEVLALPGIRDRWLVLAEHTEREDRLRTRRVWVRGLRGGHMALILDFAHGRTPFDDHYTLGTSFDGELVYYPGAHPQRALVRQRYGGVQPVPTDGTGVSHTVSTALSAYADALAVSPWLERFPVALHTVVPVLMNDVLYVRDAEACRLPVVVRPEHRWTLLAASGGHPISVVGEWNGYELALRTVVADGMFAAL